MKDKPSFPARLAGWEYQYELAASRLELAKVVDRHRKDRMHSDMKLGWEMAKEILAEAKELGDD